MRLNRLDLTRYGKFTNHCIDFGVREPGRPDLHIVFGPNEAGKSTALAAFLDLLFGIEMRSRFDFLHPYPTMRIGACVEFAGRSHELVRIKKPQNSLLDAGGAPIGEAMLAGQLGGIDRDAYRAMFSLDDDTLEKGGESILASQGDLGELLFAASTGLAELSRRLVDLRTEADGFYRPNARSGELGELKAGLTALRTERDRIDTVASRYAQLVQARDLAWEQYGAAMAARTAIQSRMDTIGRQIGALPRLAALRAARAALLPLADLPAGPAGWAEALPKLRDEAIALAVRSDAIETEIRLRSAELDTISPDEAALALGDRVDRLDVLRARTITAEKDIPVRHLEMRTEDAGIAGLLSRIGQPGETEPQRLVLDAATVGALRGLIDSRSGIEAAAAAAARELAGAQERLETARARLERADAGGATGNEAGLAAALASLRGDDHATRRRVAERSRAELNEELEERLRALLPWQGDADRLAALTVPELADIQRWKTALAAAQKSCDRYEDDLERFATERTGLDAERGAIADVAGVVSEHAAAAIRAAREAAWAQHRASLDAASADSFEAALRRDDIVMNARLGHAAEVARLHGASLAIAVIDAKAERARALFDAAWVKLQAVQGEIAAAMSPVLAPASTLAQFEAWLGRRERALETRAELRKVERDLREAAAHCEAAREKLRRALDEAGVAHDPTADLEALQAIAQGVVDRAAGIKALRAALEDCLRDAKRRERDVAAASERDRAWHAAWGEACAACWLGEPGPAPSLAAVREMLPAIADLRSALERRAKLSERVDQMQADRSAFAAEVAAIAASMGFEPGADPPLDAARAMAGRVRDARTAVAARDVAARNLNDAQSRQRKLAEALALHGRRAAEMTAHFGVASLPEVGAKLSDIERKHRFEAQAAEATRDILAAMRAESIEDAGALLDAADRAALEAELAELQARFDDQDGRTRELFATHGKAADHVEGVGGDDAVARIEERRRTILLQIEDGALRYIRLRAGVVAAEHALRAYRQVHRSSMMSQASEAFRTISRDAYTGLASQPSRESEILIAQAAGGGAKLASELSKGTRFQLYLALRVAGYHEFARSRPPVPFIADDIMETFDDDRAEESLRLFATMAQVGQVIYLTHHRHLSEIASRICPCVRIHKL